MIKKYLDYAQHTQATSNVTEWINNNLKNYLSKNGENQIEIEHIIDYLCSDKAPKRLQRMSYKEALANTDKWNKSLIKKGMNIVEDKKDTEIIKDFGDGFKIVKLIGKNAYEREGFLMRHCVSSYFGKETEVYSLRDSKNIPHCTMEKNMQIKGKGNGSINPKYIKYIVDFLEEVGMKVNDIEMGNLGYVNIKEVANDFEFTNLFKEKYFFKEDLPKIQGKDSFKLWDIFGLIRMDAKLNFSFNFNINKTIKNTIKSSSGDYAQLASSGDSAKLASSGDYAQLASSGDYAQLASSGYSAQLASSGDSAKLASSGDSAKLASSGNSAKLASSGYSAQLASSGDYAQLASSGYSAKLASSGDYAQLASSGDYAQLASSGYSAQLASSGNSAKLASSGDSAQLASSGNYGLCAGLGENSRASGKIGCWIILVEYNNRLVEKVFSFKIDGETYKENTYYTIKNGEIVEVKNG